MNESGEEREIMVEMKKMKNNYGGNEENEKQLQSSSSLHCSFCEADLFEFTLSFRGNKRNSVSPSIGKQHLGIMTRMQGKTNNFILLLETCSLESSNRQETNIWDG